MTTWERIYRAFFRNSAVQDTIDWINPDGRLCEPEGKVQPFIDFVANQMVMENESLTDITKLNQSLMGCYRNHHDPAFTGSIIHVNYGRFDDDTISCSDEFVVQILLNNAIWWSVYTRRLSEWDNNYLMKPLFQLDSEDPYGLNEMIPNYMVSSKSFFEYERDTCVRGIKWAVGRLK